MDDLDLLDATIDPSDVKTKFRVMQLKHELEDEEYKIKAKLLWKFAKLPENPMKID